MNIEMQPKSYKIPLSSNRNKIWIISGLAVLLSILGFIFSYLNPSINAPLRPGLDFTGGTQIKLERQCVIDDCLKISSDAIQERVKKLSLSSEFGEYSLNTSNIKVQFLDGYQSVLVRLPFLSSTQTNAVIDSIESITGPLEKNGLAVDTIGPSLGSQLLRSSLLSILAAFTGIVIYISFRFDRKYAFLALLALIHDIVIVSGIFAWLGILYQVEVNSLFAVALLTIAG